jgi:hypothetical protein
MAYNVTLATRITASVDRRLRMLVLLQRQPLNSVLTALLDKALPSADELAGLLRDGQGDGREAVAS